MMNFIIFNFILFGISSLIDYIATDWFQIVEWSREYIYYLFLINLPISTMLTYLCIRKIKEFLGLNS